MAKYLIADAAVHERHAQGLDFALGGQYDAAQTAFLECQAALQLLAEESPDDPARTASQMSDAVRDSGFTYVREAVGMVPGHDDTRVVWQGGFRVLELARMVTTPFVAGDAKPYSGEFRALDSNKKRRELFSAHAATLGLLGRAVTAGQVMWGEVTKDRRADTRATSDQYYYGVAHDLARSGQNHYITTSNAMRGALQERINGRVRHVVPWLGRAAMGIARAGLRGENFFSSIRTAMHVSLAMRTRKSALAFVRNPRTI